MASEVQGMNRASMASANEYNRSKTTDNGSGRVGGKFVKGNQCGRKPGVPNRSTLDARALRAVVLANFNPAEWWKWAKKNDHNRAAWLRFLGSIWPKETAVEIASGWTADDFASRDAMYGVRQDDRRTTLLQRCQAVAGTGAAITPAIVLQQLMNGDTNTSPVVKGNTNGKQASVDR